jgi:imidazole glycerol-phosphate synthase subunit HisH
MNTTAIIDYGMCNLDSVARAVLECGANPVIVQDPGQLKTATHIILPGVGAFPDGIHNIRSRGFDVAIRELAESGEIPILGICLGMQLMATTGYEFMEVEGLNLIPGVVQRLQSTNESERIPHIGWNEVVYKKESPLFSRIPSGKDFYFVHSYHFVCDEEYVIATTPYTNGFVSVVGRGNFFGTQFHPEKSQKLGLAVLRNFLKL